MSDVRQDPVLGPIVETIVAFLREIGLTVRLASLTQKTLLSGICLEADGLAVDTEKLLYPGDLLHEAGHLAVMTGAERAKTASHAGEDLGAEIGAQCWSYAAAIHLRLPPQIVFHPDGYRGAAGSLIESYRSGSVGVPLLQWMGLTLDAKRAAETGSAAYPAMVKWLRE